MPQSVVDDAAIAAAYAKFSAHFHDPSIQANIQEAKEEQYQEGFLRDLFVNVLGYTLNPQKGYELTSTLGNMFENTIAMARIIASGLLDKHPKLKLVCPHLGGTGRRRVGVDFDQALVRDELHQSFTQSIQALAGSR